MKGSLRYVLLGLILMGVAGAVFGAGQRDQAVGAPRQLEIYWNPDHLYDIYELVIDEYAAEHNLTVNKQVFSWGEFRTKLNSDMAAGTPPDLIECPPFWFLEYGTLGLMTDLTEEIDAWDESDDWFEATWREVTLDGRKLGLKLHHTAFGLFYNLEHFEAAGISEPPATLEEMRAVIDAIDAALGPDVQGFGFDPTGQYLIPFLASVETPSLIDGNAIAIDTPTVRRTLNTLQEFANSGKVFIPEPGGEEARTNVRLAFLTGRIAMMISGPWEIGNIMNNFPDLQYGVTMVPHLEGVDPLTYVAGVGIGMPADASLPVDVVWPLMQRLTATEIEVQATLEAGMLMPRQSWLDDPRIQDQRAVQLFRPLLGRAVPFDIDIRTLGLPEISWGGSVFQLLYETMIYSSRNMGQALDVYVEEANRLIRSKQ